MSVALRHCTRLGGHLKALHLAGLKRFIAELMFDALARTYCLPTARRCQIEGTGTSGHRRFLGSAGASRYLRHGVLGIKRNGLLGGQGKIRVEAERYRCQGSATLPPGKMIGCSTAYL